MPLLPPLITSLYTMKKNFSLIPIFLLVISYSVASTARLQPHHQGKVQILKANNENHGFNLADPSTVDQINGPVINDHEMELDSYVCDVEDEEEDCRAKRRIVAEAHLDYIYTQGNNESQGSP